MLSKIGNICANVHMHVYLVYILTSVQHNPLCSDTPTLRSLVISGQVANEGGNGVIDPVLEDNPVIITFSFEVVHIYIYHLLCTTINSEDLLCAWTSICDRYIIMHWFIG